MSEIKVRLGVGAIIIKGDHILLGQRNVDDNKGQWELLGGLAHDDEPLPEAIKRQVVEEAGIEIEPDVIVAHYDRYFKDKTARNAGFTFRCRLISGLPHVTEFGRVAAFQWVTLEEALKLNITPFTQLQLEQYREWLKLVS